MRVLGVLVVSLLVMLTGPAAFVSTSVAQSSGISVTLEPTDQSASAGDKVTYDVVVNGATEGISGYELSLELSNTTVATFDDWSDEHDPQFPNSDVSADRVNISAAMGSNIIEGSDTITLGTVTLTADTQGDTAVEIVNGADGVEVSNANDEQYSVNGATDGSLSVAGQIKDPALSLSPSSVSLAPGEEAGMSFEADDITRGVSSFKVTIGVSSEKTVTLDNVSVQGDSNPTVTQNSDGGVTIEAQPNRGNGDLTLASFTVNGNELGTTDLTVEDVTIKNETDDAYTPREITNATATVESQGGTASIEVRPREQEVPSGSETTLDVVVLDPGQGVSAYDMNISVNDTQVGELFEFNHTNQPLVDQSKVLAGNSTVMLSAALGSNTFDPGAEVVIANITLQTNNVGAVEISVESGAGVSHNSDGQYDITNRIDGVVTAKAGPPPIVGDTNPKDPDNDGKYEDINGDGNVNIFDIQNLFENLQNPDVTDNGQYFNFNGDSQDNVNVFDVQALFEELPKFQ